MLDRGVETDLVVWVDSLKETMAARDYMMYLQSWFFAARALAGSWGSKETGSTSQGAGL